MELTIQLTGLYERTIQLTELFPMFAACEKIMFCLCVGLIDSLGICRTFLGLRVPERRPRKRATRNIRQSLVLPGGVFGIRSHLSMFVVVDVVE